MVDTGDDKLLGVIVGISSDLELDATLDRIVTAAMELTRAKYGALAVRGADHSLTSFLHHGMPTEAEQSIGQLPVGKGILGVPLEHTLALRLDELADHPAAAGFPPDHPPMHAFLGVPINVRGKVFGSLYLTHGEPGITFSASDELAARLLASAAAVAIDNAQLFERVRATARWTEASRELTTALLSDPDAPPLQLIAAQLLTLTGGASAATLPPDDVPDTPGGLPMVAGSSLVVPLRAQDTLFGAIVVEGGAGATFDAAVLELATNFGSHAALAMSAAAARARDSELTLLADRERIAHDLHDHVIQRLFAAGLDLQGSIARSREPEVNQRLARTVDELQTTIETIRSTIFALQSPRPDDLRVRLQRLLTELSADHDVVTTFRTSGPLSAVSDRIAEQAEAVATEAISNALRHASAAHLTVAVSVADDFVLDVGDDGVGISADNVRRSGLANMTHRAELLGGRCDVTRPEGGGTRVRWSVPLLAD